jgi:parvulin-like peptidyl-prolyl isomerase
MAKKGKTEVKQVASKHVTKRRVARWQKEKRRQRIIFLSGVAVILVVVAIIIGGVVASKSNDWLSKVKTDSGTITLKKTDYANELSLFQKGVYGVYNSSTITDESPLIRLEDNYLIKDKAKEVGLSVSTAEIDTALLASFGMENNSISDLTFKTAYQNLLTNLSLSDEGFRDIFGTSLLNDKLIEYFINNSPKSAPKSGEQAAVETIEANTSVAGEIAQRWRSGESLDNLSEEYGIQSQSGWTVKGTIMNEAFDKVAFTIDIGNVSDPIPSDTGYYVLKVLERTNGTVSNTQRKSIGQTLYSSWLTEAQKDNVERNSKINLNEIYLWAVKELS